MGYRSENNSSAGAAAAILVGVLLVGLLIVGGGGAWLYFRASNLQREARMARDQAIRAEVAQRQAAEEAVAQAAAQAVANGAAPAALGTQVVLALDEDGNLLADGEPLALAELPDWLAARKQAVGEFAIVLRADKRCRFAQVAAVKQTCQEAGVEVRIAALDEAREAPPRGD